jgi:hypothetical protein
MMSKIARNDACSRDAYFPLSMSFEAVDRVLNLALYFVGLTV